MKRALKLFGVVTLLGSIAGGMYYYLFVRARKPQVELYFDDGSMVSLPADGPDAAPFMRVAQEVIKVSPVSR